MSAIIKTIIYALVFIMLVLFFLLYTALGQKATYLLLSYYASHKSGLEVKIKNINLHQYPYIRVDTLIEEKYTLNFNGFLDNLGKNISLDMNYDLNSSCIESKICTLDDRVNIHGKIKGKPRKELKITGEGTLLDGTTNYVLTREKKVFKNVNLLLHDMNSSKLLKLLGEKALFKGKADAKLHFDYLSKRHKKGNILYDVKDNNFSGFIANLHIDVDIEDDNHTFIIDVTSPSASLHLDKGVYNQTKKEGHAFYRLNIKELSDLKSILKQKYVGAFNIFGEVAYNKQTHISIKGLSKSLGGILDFSYAKKRLQVDFKDVPFKNIMQRLSYSPILNSTLNGQIVYYLKNRSMQAKAKLKNAKFIPSKLTKKIKEKLNINISDETFDKSYIEASYNNKVLSSKIVLANKKNHLLLKDTKIDPHKKSIDTYIDLKIPKHQLKGKLFARADEYITQDVYLKFKGDVEKHYNISLDGLINENLINMDYKLHSARLPSHICTIEDNVSLEGHLNGPFSRLRIRGKGEALDGNISYDGIKIGNTLEELNIQMNHIHALKLSTLLGYPDLPTGKADIKAYFSHLSKEKKSGNIHYTLSNATYKNLPLSLVTKVNVADVKQNFVANISLGNAKIDLSKGTHDLKTRTTNAFFTLQTKDLTKLEPLLKNKYLGDFQATGKIRYHDDFEIRGLTKTFGGMTDFLYKKDMLYIDLEAISFKRFMSLFPYPLILDATLTGNINYNFKKELLLVKTNLNNTRFISSDIVNTIYEKAQIDISKERFNQSSLEGNYHNGKLFANLKLANKTSHFFLTETSIDTKQKMINAQFDFKMQGQEFSGKIYGLLNKPKIDLNMRKLIKYQMDKQMDTYMGKENRKLMESMPMGDVVKDMAAEMGGGFMDVFF